MSFSISIYRGINHEEQQLRVGEEVNDKPGCLWSYVELTPGTYKKGHLLQDVSSSDLIGNSGLGTVTASAAKDTTILKDTGEFTATSTLKAAGNLDGLKDLRGAIGTIVEGGGVGQTFQVIKVRDKDTLEIRIAGKNGDGWAVPLTTSSKYRLTMPGRVKLAENGATVRARGVIQEDDDVTVDDNKFRYSYARKTGAGEGLIDVSGRNIADNLLVVPNGRGLLAGIAELPGSNTLAATKTWIEASRRAVGKAMNGHFSGGEPTIDTLLPIEFMIVNNSLSFRQPRMKEDPVISVS